MNTALDARKAIQGTLGTKQDGIIGPHDMAALNALTHAADAAPWPPVPVSVPPATPPATSGATINTIIDLNHDNGFDIPKLKAASICAVILKATQGTKFRDPLYLSRRAAAKAAGLLVGSYHFNSAEDPAEQAKAYVAFADPKTDELMSFDWEEIPNNLTLAQAHIFVQTIHDLTGRYPMIYGSNVCREAVGTKPDALLAKCAYWHVRYNANPIGIPTQIWPTYDLWQYDDGTHDPVPGSDGADRNKFQGTEADLRAAWPLTKKIA